MGVAEDDKSGLSLSTFSGWEMLFDRGLRISEAAVVITITLVLILLVGREIHWVWISPDPAIRQQRIEAALRMANDDWKVGILIIVPLFYRIIRMFLERVRKAGWLVAEPIGVVKAKNPPEPEDDGAVEEEPEE